MRDHANLTLRVDAQVLLWARMRALRDGTSINRRVRQYLAEYAAIPPEKRWPDAPPLDSAVQQPTEEPPERAPPNWPDEDPGPAGEPGRPADHAHLYGRDGHVTSNTIVWRDRRREYWSRPRIPRRPRAPGGPGQAGSSRDPGSSRDAGSSRDPGGPGR